MGFSFHGNRGSERGYIILASFCVSMCFAVLLFFVMALRCTISQSELSLSYDGTLSGCTWHCIALQEFSTLKWWVMIFRPSSEADLMSDEKVVRESYIYIV